MNSALKPVLPQPGVPQPGGQSSPAKGNVASANHAGALPQGAQNHSLPAAPNHALPSAPNHALPSAPNHALPSAPSNALPAAPSHALPGGPGNSLHSGAPHPAACMAPVSANMAQMAQNMSHHGNLSHMPLPPPASPSKAASTSAPLSLVQDKVPPPSQPLALTRTPDKKEPESTAQANGTIDSPKSATNAPAVLKPQNPETNKDKQDIAKTSPSTPKPPEKPSSAPSTPQKIEPAIPSSPSDVPAQPKVATANEPPEKSPSKPIELKQAPAADVAPTQSDSKPVPESANDSQLQEKVPPPKQEAPSEVPKESPKVDVKQDEPKVDKPPPVEEKEDVKEKVDAPKVEAAKVDTPKVDTLKVEPEKPQKTEVVPEKVEEKKPPTKAELKPKSTLKLATVTPPMRKRRQASPSKPTEGPGPAKKAAEGDSTPDSRTKRNRTKVQLYQSPTPELAMATKLSASAGRSTPTKPNDDKLIVFYKNEYLAVRNAEGGFYVCQTMQNVYRTTRKIKIRWLSQDKTADPSGETYKPDFYDVTDMECVLTTLSLQRAAGGAQSLRRAERDRAESILLRALRAERPTHLTPEHPDGLDLSLYTDESQLEKKSRKRNSSKSSPRAKLDQDDDTTVESATPVKKARTTPKRSPKSARKTKITPTKIQNNNKRKSPGSTPIVAATSKTATAVSEKAKAKSTPAKRTPVKHKDTPVPRKATRASRESKPSPIVPTPSTSTGKTTRTPRKPPAKK